MAKHMTSLTFPYVHYLVTRTTSGVVVHLSQGEGGRETVYTNASLTSAIIVAPSLKLGAPGFRTADFPHTHVVSYPDPTVRNDDHRLQYDITYRGT